jgi:HKD family nuclease
MIDDSHIRSLQSRKLYRKKKVKIHTLGEGQKNIAGAKTYFESLTTTCKHFVVIVGSNDLSRGATVTQVHQDLQNLKERLLSKFKDCVLNIPLLFHRKIKDNLISK